MSFEHALAKIASDSRQIDSIEKLASCYDEIGRHMAQQMFKQARKLPPGAFSGKKGLLKLLGVGGVGAVGYGIGAHQAKSKAKEDDVAIAQQAYHAGVRRGVGAIMQKLRESGMG